MIASFVRPFRCVMLQVPTEVSIQVIVTNWRVADRNGCYISDLRKKYSLKRLFSFVFCFLVVRCNWRQPKKSGNSNNVLKLSLLLLLGSSSAALSGSTPLLSVLTVAGSSWCWPGRSVECSLCRTAHKIRARSEKHWQCRVLLHQSTRLCRQCGRGLENLFSRTGGGNTWPRLMVIKEKQS